MPSLLNTYWFISIFNLMQFFVSPCKVIAFLKSAPCLEIDATLLCAEICYQTVMHLEMLSEICTFRYHQWRQGLYRHASSHSCTNSTIFLRALRNTMHYIGYYFIFCDQDRPWCCWLTSKWLEFQCVLQPSSKGQLRDHLSQDLTLNFTDSLLLLVNLSSLRPHFLLSLTCLSAFSH